MIQRSVSTLLPALCATFLFQAASAQTPINDHAVPSWLRDGTIYEIFPRHFSASGNLNGVTVRLDELQDLGVTVLWTMPVHPIGEKMRKGKFGSPYSIRDYYAIDPNYGTLADFKALVDGAHQRGMKVIMDVVVGHTAWDSVMMTNLAFYKQDASGHPIPPVKEWTDVAGLNYSNPAVRDYVIAMLKYWIKEADVDGFRCDTAGMIPTDFWEQARVEVMKAKPDLIMLAEASKPELLTNAFDIDYSWPMLNALNRVLIGSEPASAISKSWEESRMEFPKGALHMRISDDHDEPRAVARYGIKGALAASVLVFTLDGVPLLYNGMEVGDATESGDAALFDKLPILWEPKDRPAQLRRTYRNLIQLRKQYPAFSNSNVQWLHNSEENSLVTFVRADDKGEFLVAINFSNRPIRARVDLNSKQDFAPVKIAGVEYSDGSPAGDLNLKGFEWRIYRRSVTVASSK